MSPQSCGSARVAASLRPVYYFLIKAAKFGKLKNPVYICGSSVSFLAGAVFFSVIFYHSCLSLAPLVWLCLAAVMSQSHGISGGTTEMAFRSSVFCVRERDSVDLGLL